jgi:hypothetical protein
MDQRSQGENQHGIARRLTSALSSSFGFIATEFLSLSRSPAHLEFFLAAIFVVLQDSTVFWSEPRSGSVSDQEDPGLTIDRTAFMIPPLHERVGRLNRPFTKNGVLYETR